MNNIHRKPKSREEVLYVAEKKQVEYYARAFKEEKPTNIILNPNGYTDLRKKK